MWAWSTAVLINSDIIVCEWVPNCPPQVLLQWKNDSSANCLFQPSVCVLPMGLEHFNGPSLLLCLLQLQRPWCEPWSCWTTWQRSTTTVTWPSWAPWWQSSPWTPSWPRWSSPAVNSTVPMRSSPSLPCCQVMLRAGPAAWVWSATLSISCAHWPFLPNDQWAVRKFTEQLLYLLRAFYSFFDPSCWFSSGDTRI